MKLRELDATFVGRWNDSGYHRFAQTIEPGVQGLCFQCPICAVGKVHGEEAGVGYAEDAHYVLVWFANPIAAAVAPPEADSKPHHRWTFAGSSIDDATLTPSVNLDIPNPETGVTSGCRWHGWVKDGDAT
jgi:hypothetical protein